AGLRAAPLLELATVLREEREAAQHEIGAVKALIVAERSDMPVKLKLSGAVALRVVVEALPEHVHPKHQAVLAFVHRPVVLELKAAAAETNRVQRGVKRNAAIGHGDVDVVALRSELDSQTRRSVREIGGDVGQLMGDGELRMRYCVRIQHKC